MGGYESELGAAVKAFWRLRSLQEKNQKKKDQGTRGAVTGGKQMDGFVALVRKITIDAGIPEGCIYTRENELPGFFRPTKEWDLLVISPQKKLVACFEFKSQVGSFGNNFNNRAEEAIGSATDIWTAFREGVFGTSPAPWLGYVMVVEKCEKSSSPVSISSPHFKAIKEFDKTSYLDRYGILCRKLVRERLYTTCVGIWTKQKRGGVEYGGIPDTVSFDDFARSYAAYLKGRIGEFG